MDYGHTTEARLSGYHVLVTCHTAPRRGEVLVALPAVLTMVRYFL